jgi:hypothetical protein
MQAEVHRGVTKLISSIRKFEGFPNLPGNNKKHAKVVLKIKTRTRGSTPKKTNCQSVL